MESFFQEEIDYGNNLILERIIDDDNYSFKIKNKSNSKNKENYTINNCSLSYIRQNGNICLNGGSSEFIEDFSILKDAIQFSVGNKTFFIDQYDNFTVLD